MMLFLVFSPCLPCETVLAGYHTLTYLLTYLLPSLPACLLAFQINEDTAQKCQRMSKVGKVFRKKNICLQLPIEFPASTAQIFENGLTDTLSTPFIGSTIRLIRRTSASQQIFRTLSLGRSAWTLVVKLYLSHWHPLGCGWILSHCCNKKCTDW